MIERYKHHDREVAVQSDLKGKHREHCLCFNYKNFDPDNREENCPIANMLYCFCVLTGLTTPVYECPEFVLEEEDNG